uniref:ribonuclease H n=1 Tax=Mimiviridae sp. ChoanoV1 TaxID=2596887 RepID=A0A5B8HW58_9VIRU|nr:RNase H [Mimiviridae sp. ChoanoV1]
MNSDIRKYFSTAKVEPKKKSKKKSNKEWKVFTDGSTINNGKRNAKGGIGIFFDDDSPDNLGEEFNINGKTSNNICELEAVRRAINIIIKKKEFKSDDKILICSDSTYVIDCITKWSNTWEKNGWMRRNKGGKKVPVKNVELIKEIKKLYYQYTIQFKHIKAHRNLNPEIKKSSLEYKEWYGNKMADEFANVGSGK